ARLQETPDGLGLPLLDGYDQGGLTHLVGSVDLRAHFKQPFEPLIEADPRRSDERCIAPLAAQVRVGALVQEETSPFLVTARDGDNQRRVSIAITRIDEPPGG